eukprot:COSAG04_NODE_18960_length_428_cov_0.948328_1_plen_44_part_01
MKMSNTSGINPVRRALQALSATGLEPYKLTDLGRPHKERCHNRV